MTTLLNPSVPPQQSDLSFQDAWNVLIRNRTLIAGCTALVIAGAAAWAYFVTPVYQAEASIRIDEQKSKLPMLDALQELSNGSDLATEIEVLNSRTMAENVIDSLALRFQVTRPSRIARDELFGAVSVKPNAPVGGFSLKKTTATTFVVTNDRTRRGAGTAKIGIPFSIDGTSFTLRSAAEQYGNLSVALVPQEKAVTAFRKSLKVSRPSRTANVVVVRYEGRDRHLVSEVPNVLADRFIRRRREVQKTETRSIARFLRQQLDTLALQLTEAENTLKGFREGAQVVNLSEEASAQVDRLARLEGERSSLDAERAALAALLAEVRVAAQQLGPDAPSPYRRMLAFPTLFKNPSTNETLRALTDLESERAALLARRTSKDPDVQALTAHIRELEDQLRSVAETYLQGLTNQVAALDASLAQLGRQLEKIPAKEVEFARLERRPKILEEIYTLLQTRLKEAEISEAAEDPSVRVVDAAITPTYPFRPKKGMVVGMAAVLGFLFSLGIAFARELMDRTVHTKEDVQAFTNVNVLGLIPRIRARSTKIQDRAASLKRFLRPQELAVQTDPAAFDSRPMINERLIAGADPRSPVSEAYRTLRTNITFARPEKAPKVLIFTSPMPGDGKTTSAANLAITLAQQRLRILLVDADMRKGVLNSVFEAPREPGLSNVLIGTSPLGDAVHRVELVDTGLLDFLSTGTFPPNPAELLGSERMREVLLEMQARYDAVILDTPPLNMVTDAAILGTIGDGVVLIARAGVTEKASLAYAVEQLRNVRAPLLGAVLNDVDFESTRYYGMYGRYAYYQYSYAYKADNQPTSSIPLPLLPNKR